ncbi:MAG: ABC transporter substrate-binding protein [Prevotella sp.]|nr:ABC transporter substrate-binding protein [Prevotella sp.]
MYKERLETIAGWIAVTLIALLLILILLSWILNASSSAPTVNSLLSEEGIRWFIGQFTKFLSTPALIWLLLLSIAWGTYRESGIGTAMQMMINGKKVSYRQRFSFRVSMIICLFLVIVIILLIAVPHAILLSSTGTLFPSSFSAAIIPIIAFIITVVSVSFAIMVGKVKTVGAFMHTLAAGLADTLPLWVLYILFMQLYQSLRFVFM